MDRHVLWVPVCHGKGDFMIKKSCRYMSAALAAIAIMQCIPTTSVVVSASTVLEQGGVTSTIKWAVVDDGGIKTLRLIGTGIIPAQTAGKQAWANYVSGVTRLEISEGITSVGKNAFANTIPDVTDISLPASLQSIFSGAFDGCKVTNIALGKNISSLDGNVFAGISTIKTVIVDSDNKWFESIDGVVYNKSSKSLCIYPRAKADADFTIPDYIVYIGVKAFYGNTHLRTISGKNIMVLYDHAFDECTNLETDDFPALVTISEYAYSNCTSLKLLRRYIQIVTTIVRGWKRLKFLAVLHL